MKTRCSKSWTDVNVDFKNRLIRHCCKAEPYTFPDEIGLSFLEKSTFLDNSPQIQKRRQDTLNGVQHSDCSACWRDINSGQGAYKDWMNKWDDDAFNSRDLTKPHVNYIDIELDNTCDLSCLYCSSLCSSKIAQEEGVAVIDNTRQQDITNFMTWFDELASTTTEEVTVNFLGGEPTASKLFYELVDFIKTTIQKYPKFDVCIEVCTNCNSKPFLMDKLLYAMDNSTATWAITISNESYGADSELIRYGLDWKRFVHNFNRYVAHPRVSSITLAPTLNAFNLPSFAQYICFAHTQLASKKKNWGWVGSHVTWPNVLDIKYLPDEYKQYIVNAQLVLDLDKNNDRFRNYERFSNFLSQMTARIGSEYNPDYKQALQEFIDEKQRVKQTDKLSGLMKLF
tara:strand:+ start:14615 stop:15805 length:1191 start_codon:yes stop_codon:yes gene_type:complete